MFVPVDRLLHKKPSAVEAAKKAFILNRIGDPADPGWDLPDVRPLGSIEYRDIFAQAQPYIEMPRGKFRRSRDRAIDPRPAGGGRSARKRSCRCMSGCPTRWKARRRCRVSDPRGNDGDGGWYLVARM